MSKNIKKCKLAFWFLIPFLLLVLVFGYLYREKYLKCLTKDFSLCVKSKKYISPAGKFMFRYPNDYPITAKTEEELKKQYQSDFSSSEWVNFSTEFYPEAGGDRLGNIIVEKDITYKDVKEYANEELSDFEVPLKIEYVKIGGKNAVCSQQSYNFNSPGSDCYITYKGELYIISFNYDDYYHKLPIRYYEKAKQLILSTFTLIN